MTWVMRRAPVLPPDVPPRAPRACRRTPIDRATRRTAAGCMATWLIGARDEANGSSRSSSATAWPPTCDAGAPTAISRRATCPASAPTDEPKRAHAWRSCSASSARSPTTTCPGARRRRRACSGRRCASRTRTRATSTGSRAGSFADVEHPELGRSFRYATSKWLAPARAGRSGGARRCWTRTREAVLAEPAPRRPAAPASPPARSPRPAPLGARQAVPAARRPHPRLHVVPRLGRRHALPRGARRRVHQGRVEGQPGHAPRRDGAGRRSCGARRRRPRRCTGVTDPDMGGQFNNKNPGKRGISLNVRHPKGLEIARRLVAMSRRRRRGLLARRARQLGPRLRRAASRSSPTSSTSSSRAWARTGTYGRFRTVGPDRAAPSPARPRCRACPSRRCPRAGATPISTGWAPTASRWRSSARSTTATAPAKGQWIDASQCEVGLFLNGTTILDWSANGRAWPRYGNRSPYKPAAPHGAYRCAGDDRWIAIACFTDERVARARGRRRPSRVGAPIRASRRSDARLANQDALDALVAEWTSAQDALRRMQRAAGGRRAGRRLPDGRRPLRSRPAARGARVADRGHAARRSARWPVAEVPVKLSATPAYIGGPDRPRRAVLRRGQRVRATASCSACRAPRSRGSPPTA